jgi:folate-binding protein YgfZ
MPLPATGPAVFVPRNRIGRRKLPRRAGYNSAVDADGERAYRAALEGAAFRAEPAGVLDIAGPSREAFLHGQVANEVRSLPAGSVVPAAALTPQGKLLYLARVMVLDDRFRLILPASCLPAARKNLAKFAAFDQVTVTDRSEDLALFALAGPYWRIERINEWIGAPASRPGAASPLDESGVFLGGKDGSFFLLVRGRDRQRFATGLAAEAVWLADEAAEIRRVEEQRPLWGVDVDGTNVPDEVGLDAWVSSSKGCYVGQEVVARMRTYGQPARRLVAFHLEADHPVAPGEVLLRSAADPRPAGRLTSVVRSPRAGAIALGYAARGACESPGARLALASGGEAIRAEGPLAADRPPR